jgi:DNA-binding beta-propeller fold protein YncE
MKMPVFLKTAFLLLVFIPAAWAQSLGTTNLLEGPAAGNDSVALAAGGTWTATANAAWLHLSAANQSGAGSTNVVFTFDANPGATRTGTLTIACQTLTVTQAGSTYVAVTNAIALVSTGLSSPDGVAVDGAGNVYIADYNNGAIKEWLAVSNTFITLVSSGLSGPSGVAVDGAGNVYVADAPSYAVKKWVAASNTIITLVSSGLSWPSDVAVDRSGNVYIADYYNSAIKKWVVTNNTVATLVSSGLATPAGVAVDGMGNIYIADTYNNAIEEWISASNTVITLVSSGLSYPYRVAVDSAGNVYFDAANNAIAEWLAVSNTVITLASFGLSGPTGVGVDGAGNVYIADTGNNALKELPHAFVDPTPKLETATSGSDSLPVVLPATANLTGPLAPVSDSAWLNITGVSNGVVNFAFTPNTMAARAANITLLGQSINVIQMGSPNYSLATTNLLEGPTSGSDSVMFVAGDAWTATPNVDWLHLSAASQSGLAVNTNLVFTFDSNLGATRTGTLTIGGQILTITQAGSTYVATTDDGAPTFVDPTTKVETAAAGSDALPVVLPVTVDLTGTNAPISDSEWLTITGVTNGVVSFAFPPNTMALRTGHIRLLGQSIAVTQLGPSTYTFLGTTNLVEGNSAASDSVILTAGGIWSATPNAAWLHVSTAYQSGVGSTNVVFTFDANPGATRTGTLTIAGQTLTVTQAGSTYVAVTGLATFSSSGFNTPHGVAVDGVGNVYIADTGNNAIKEWLVASNTITTLVSSGLNSPQGVAVDGAGNVYIADTGNNAIKEWLVASNTITTLVSSGLNSPQGVAVDGAGNVYIADSGNNVITKWTAASNTVVTLVSSGLSQPYGVAVDGAGNVYIADTQNNAIRELPRAFADPTPKTETAAAGGDTLPMVLPVTANLTGLFAPVSDASWLTITGVTNGVVSFAFTANTMANRRAHILLLWQSITVTQTGNPYIAITNATALASSGLSQPYGVAVDGAGNVYIADTGNNAIREWIAASNIVTTLLSSGLNSPSGVAVDGAGNVYIADTGNNAIREWTVANGTVTALVSSGLANPSGVAVDGAGNVYIADTGNNAIREWTVATGTVTALVSSGLANPSGVAVDGTGNVYIADTGNNAIKEWVSASNIVTTLVSLGLSQPCGVAVDGAGNVYIADTGNNAIKELPCALVAQPTQIETAAAGNDALPAVVPATANLTGPFAPVSDSPWLTISGVTNGVVSFAFTANNSGSIRTAHITLLGQSIPVTQMHPVYSLGTTNLVRGSPAGSGSVVLSATPKNFPWTAAANTFWLHLNAANQSGTGSANVIFTFDANTGATRAGTLTIAGQTLTVTQAGSTYVAATNVTTLASTVLPSPSGVAVDGAGNVYFVDSYDNFVKEWMAANNTVTTLVSSGLFEPEGVAVDGAGNVYIADKGNKAIKEWIAASDTVTTLVSSGLNFPQGVAVDSAGNVYIADSGNNAVKEWIAANNTVTTLVSSGLSDPSGVAVNGAGNVYFKNNMIKEWVASSNTVITVVTTGSAGLAVDGAGNIYMDRSGALSELPYAFVDPTPKVETAVAGSDALPAVLPATANLTWPFAPVSDSSWLTITGVTNGVVSFAYSTNFSANTMYSRTAHITLLGQKIAVTQVSPPYFVLGTTNSVEGPMAGSDSVVLAANGPWTATADASWLHLSAANQSGTGSTNVIFTFDANPGATRAGTLAIAGQTLTVTQAGPTYVAVSNITTLVSSGLSTPTGVAVDGAGNVYIADYGNSAIKEWMAASNTVTTLVSSGLLSPWDVAMDGSGNFYITDAGHNAIKEWAVASNTLITLISSGISQPYGIAVDGAGNVYFAAGGNNAIEEWIAASNTVIALVSSGLNYCTGVAVDGAGNVYIADHNNNAIKEWKVASSTVTTLASSGLNHPYAVAVNGAGNVYFADSGNSTIKEWVAASNTVTTLVSSGLNSPDGVAVDGMGNVYIADSHNYAIKELPHAFLDPTAKTETAAAGSDALPVVLPSTVNLTGSFAPVSDSPWLTITGVTNGVVGFAFTANTMANRTGRISLLGQSIVVTQVGPPNYYSLGTANLVEGSPAGSDSVTLVANGTWTATTNSTWLHLSAANQSGTGSTNVIFTFDANPGATRIGTLTIAGQTLTITQAGSTYVSATSVSTLVSSGLNAPAGVAVDGSGNVYIADTGNNAIKEWTPASNSVTTLVSSGLSNPYGVAVDGADNVYIADTGNNVIKEWTAANQSVSTLVSSGLKFPYGVAVDGAGNVYIADTFNNAVKERIATSDTITTLSSLGLFYPSGVAVGGAGNVYIADKGHNAIEEWIAARNTVTALVSSGLNSPCGVAVDGAGNVYIADTLHNAIKKLPRVFVDPTAKTETAIAGSDVLPVVVPDTANLTGPFAPVSDSAWLTITGVANGVVGFTFATNYSTNRTAHIALLGRSISVTQPAIMPPILTGCTILGDGACQFCFTNNQGVSFTVWTSPDISLPFTNWTLLGTLTNNGSGQFQFTDLTATNNSQRFYRVSSP